MTVKHKQILVIALIALVFWANYNIFFNLHLHIGVDGRPVVHVHPFARNAGENGKIPYSHTHSQNELVFLSILFQTLSFLLFFVILLFLCLQRKRRNPVHRERVYESLIQKHPVNRGPPLFQS
ncbi:MAG TPA: hypothetical protein ENN17_01370 [bacterium]|nr:hypothetical protein [bacterium]